MVEEMEMDRRIIIVGIVSTVVLLVFSGCLDQEDKEKSSILMQRLVGDWYYPMVSHFYVVFYENGTGDWCYYNDCSQFEWTIIDEEHIIWYNYMGTGNNSIFHCDFMDPPAGMTGYDQVQVLFLNVTEGEEYSGMFFTSENLRLPSPMAGLPWICESSGELFLFGYMDSVGLKSLKIRNESSYNQYEYDYANGYLTVKTRGWDGQNEWTTNLIVEFEEDNKMKLTWYNSSDGAVRWNDLVLIRAEKDKELTEQYTSLVTFVMGFDGIYEIPNYSGSQYNIFEFYGLANVWCDLGVGEWTEEYPGFDPIDENGVIIADDDFGGDELPQFNYSQYGTDLIVSYITETLGVHWSNDSEILVYNNDYYGQRIYYKENSSQSYPYLVGLGREFNMIKICWILGYNYSWMWTSNCNYVEEPGLGIYIDIGGLPTTVQTGLPFDICLRFYNVEGGELVDPSSFFVRIGGSPCSDDFMRNATGVYYLYDFILDDSGTHSVNISAYRGSMTSMSSDEKNFEIIAN